MIKKDMDLISRIPAPEVDIATLKNILKASSDPFARIRYWVNQGVLTRMGSGWYILGEPYRKRLWSREYMANVLHGPSYISLSYALSFHSLIPERVVTVTSITTGKSRVIETPLGRFSYKQVPERVFRAGRDLYIRKNMPSFFIATPEKALADTVNQQIFSKEMRELDMYEYLTENLRIERKDLMGLDISALERVALAYRSRKVFALVSCIRFLNSEGDSPNERSN